MPLSIGLGISPTLATGVGGDPILAAFADGTDGFYFDFSKTDRLFQETTGITPADDPAENIGLALDSHGWGGRTLAQEKAGQAELVTNGSGSTTAGWTPGEDGTMSSASGWLVHTNPATLTSLGDRLFYQAITCVVGRSYEVSAEVDPRTSPNVILSLATSVGVADSTQPRVSRPTQGTARFIFVATAATMYLRIIGDFTATPSASFAARNISIKAVVGSHATQATAAAQPKYQTGGLARFDGLDDNLLTTLNPGASMTYMFKGKITSASKVLMGSRATVDTRSFIGTDAAGLLAAGVGIDSTTTIMGGPDIRGLTGVGGLVYSASGVSLYWNGAQIYSGPLNGVPNTSIPIRLGSLNDNGTASTFADADAYYQLAIKKALTSGQIAAITNKWGTT